MYKDIRKLDLALGGGGIKGIAYAGVFDAAEAEGIRWGNIAGVSAGALAGAYAGAGYNAKELRKILDSFDFSNIDLGRIQKKVAAVAYYLDFKNSYRGQIKNEERIMDIFLGNPLFKFNRNVSSSLTEFSGYRGGLFKNIITLSKEGCLCDGDYLEEWVYRMLAKKGVKTFGDLRGGIADSKNPSGYKVRMTAVDATRTKVITLPDDIAFYGMNPDKLEVSKAVRMSTCVPFAFKPVEITKQDGNNLKTYYIVDGGVLDNFPSWLLDYSDMSKVFGFRLVGNDKNKLLSIDTPLNVMKALITTTHDIGAPKAVPKLKYLGDIDTADISFLDFNLSEKEKQYLYISGRDAANKLIFQFKNSWGNRERKIFSFFKEIGRKM